MLGRMRAAILVMVAVAGAVTPLEPIVVAKPAFGGPVRDVSATGSTRLELVSSRRVEPSLGPPPASAPAWASPTFGETQLLRTIRQPSSPRQPAVTLLVYGRDSTTARYVLGNSPTGRLRYAFDFARFWRSPQSRDAMPQQVVWAAERGGVLFVETAHLGYASTSKGRNAYLTAIELASGRIVWRTPALVANASTFVVTDDVIVAGYGFTAEPDFLYMVDRRTGRLRQRLALPTAPERITLRQGLLRVRTYDHMLTMRLTR